MTSVTTFHRRRNDVKAFQPAGRPADFFPMREKFEVLAGSAESVILHGGIRAEADDHEIESGREKPADSSFACRTG